MDLLRALAFLTVLPVPRVETSSRDLGRSSAWFPVVGALIGALLLAADLAFRRILPPLPASALIVVIWAFLTRGFHLDGLADTFDGIGGGFDRKSRLSIMKDSRLGTFGGIALAAALLLKTTALASLSGTERSAALLLAPVLGRWAILFAMTLFPSARPGGLGDACRKHCPVSRLLLGSAAAVPIVLAVAGRRGAALLALAPGGALLLSTWISHLLGGLTGDSYGAVCETTEIAALLFFAAAMC